MSMSQSMHTQQLQPAYSRSARLLHWLTALLVLSVIPMGIALDKLPPGPVQDNLYDLHRSFGVVIIALTIWRLLDRVKRPPRPLGAEIPALQRFAAGAVHVALYAMLIINPLLGWVGASIYGASLNFFWLVTIPPPFAKNEALAEKLLAAHSILGFAMAAALCLHIGAALFHYFILKDRVLQRITGSA